jgi:hypothetical protein
MKWNTEGKKWQQTKRGTTRAREMYFITRHGTGSNEWAVGYKGYGRLVEMKSAGTFKSASDARAYCEQLDAAAVIIEEITA